MRDPMTAQLITMRDHHLAEAKRYEQAIATLREVAKIAGKASKLTGKVAARASADGPVDAKAAAKRKRDADRARRKYHEGVRAKANGTRPLDRIRGVFREAGSKPLSPEVIAERAKIGESMPEHVVPRVVGNLMRQMVLRKEIKAAKGGTFVAVKIMQPSNNGDGAAHA